MKSLSTGFVVLALIGCGKDHNNKDTRTQPESQKPASAVAPAPVAKIPAELLGTWTLCKEYGLDETFEGLEFPVRSERTLTRFDAQGTMSKTIAFFSDSACKKLVTEADIKAYIKRLDALGIETDDPEELMAFSRTVDVKATYAIVADLGQGQFQYNTTFEDNVIFYETLQVSGNTLRLSYACDADDVGAGICEKVTADSAQNRAVLDANAIVMSRVP